MPDPISGVRLGRADVSLPTSARPAKAGDARVRAADGYDAVKKSAPVGANSADEIGQQLKVDRPHVIQSDWRRNIHAKFAPNHLMIDQFDRIFLSAKFLADNPITVRVDGEEHGLGQHFNQERIGGWKGRRAHILLPRGSGEKKHVEVFDGNEKIAGFTLVASRIDVKHAGPGVEAELRQHSTYVVSNFRKDPGYRADEGQHAVQVSFDDTRSRLFVDHLIWDFPGIHDKVAITMDGKPQTTHQHLPDPGFGSFDGDGRPGGYAVSLDASLGTHRVEIVHDPAKPSVQLVVSGSRCTVDP